jgi:hypothetical protein
MNFETIDEILDPPMRMKGGFIQCRATAGVQLAPSKPWRAGSPVRFAYMPCGQHHLEAGFRAAESISIAVLVDPQTADDLQKSFDDLCATNEQEPYCDEDHRSSDGSTKATVRFPKDGVTFSYGEIKGKKCIVAEGQIPTGYGATVVNDGTYKAFSPEFSTDADYDSAKCTMRNGKRHWTFSEGIRGSEENPARIMGINFVTGALTNRPAFSSIPAVSIMAKRADVDGYIIKAHWHIEKRGRKWHVIKDDGKDEGASDSEAMAKRHMAALYANSPDTKASFTGGDVIDQIRADRSADKHFLAQLVGNDPIAKIVAQKFREDAEIAQLARDSEMENGCILERALARHKRKF